MTIRSQWLWALLLCLSITLGAAEPAGIKAQAAGEALSPTTASDGAVQTGADSFEAESVEVRAKRPSSSATFGGRDLVDVPFSVGRVSRETIEDQRAFSRREVLKNDASVNLLLGYIGDDAFTIRGFTNRWANDMIRVDGLATAFVRGGSAAVEAMEQVEVLKGVAALRYGFAPPGGVLNYERKRPSAQGGLTLSVDGRSNGNLLSVLDADGHLGAQGQLGYRLVASAEKIQGFQDYTDGKRSLLSGLLQWAPRKGLDFELVLDQQERVAGFEGMIPIAADTKRIFTDLPRTFSWYAPDAEYATKTHNLSLGGSLGLAEGFKLKVKGLMSEGMSDYDMYGYGGWALDDGSLDLYEWNGINLNSGAAQQTHLEGKFSTGPLRHDLALGYAWSRQDARGQNYIYDFLGTANVYDWPPSFASSTGTSPVPDSRLSSRTDEWGVFLTDFIGIGEHFELFGGARLADLEVKSYGSFADPVQYHRNAISPSGALIFKPAQGMSTYAVYSEGLQQGGTAPLGSTNYLEQMPPIRVQQGELGFKADRGTWAANLAYFYIRLPLEYVDSSNTFVQNGRQVHQGGEASFSVAPFQRLRLSAGGMLLDAKQLDTGSAALDNTQPDGAVRLQGNIAGDLELGAGFSFNSALYYVGSKSVGSAEDLFLPAYTRWDAGLRYGFKALENDYKVRLNVQNLTGSSYIESAGFWGAGAGNFGGWAIYGVPLNATLSLEARL